MLITVVHVVFRKVHLIKSEIQLELGVLCARIVIVASARGVEYFLFQAPRECPI